MAPAMPGAPTATAAMVAAYRARATRKGTCRCHDPWAHALAGDLGEQIVEEFDRLVPSMELLVAVRTAVFDEQVGRAVDQVVLVGSGLDSRGARFARHGLRFYEIDQAKSLDYKMARVRMLHGYPAAAIEYVACDLEQEDVVGALCATAFQASQPALFLCEGVVPYLSEAAVGRMLTGISETCHEDSIVVLDHVVHQPTAEAIPSVRERAIRERLEGLGEPLRFGSGDALALLNRAGFRHTQSIGLEDAYRRMTGSSEPAPDLQYQQVTIASRRSPGGTSFSR